MSKLIVKPNDSGIGEVKITAPNTNSTRYQLLPDVSGNVVVSDGSLLTVSQGGSSLNFGGATKLEGAVQGLHKWEIVNSNTTLTINRNYFANTRGQSDLTLTLPASANVGDTIQVIDNEGFCSSNNIFIANGTSTQTIDGGVRKLTLTTDRESVKLFYTGSSWISKQQETTLPKFQGTISGYTSGGAPGRNTIDKYPFASDANATDVGDLTAGRGAASGQSSEISGYTSGGYAPGADVIDKFPFAVDANAVDVGNLSQARRFVAGQSSTENGYVSGGNDPVSQFNTIDKYPFSTDTNATDIANLSRVSVFATGQSSTTHGYTSGGYNSPPPTTQNIIDKFPFATDTNATDVGNLTQARTQAAGQSSTEFGYTSGGYSPGALNTIDKFPFATDTNATDVGNLTQSRRNNAGQSSTVNGYTSGGNAPPTVVTIDKFPFATDTNATDVGDLTQARDQGAGQQH